MTLFSRFAIPFNRFGHILIHTIASFKARAYIKLSIGIPMVSGFAIPFNRFGYIFIHAIAGFKARAYTKLRLRMTLFSGFAKPFQCFVNTCINAVSTTIITHSEIKLCFGIPLFRRFAIPFNGFVRMSVFIIAIGKAKLCLYISFLCGFEI